jgi:hypothetical protein
MAGPFAFGRVDHGEGRSPDARHGYGAAAKGSPNPPIAGAPIGEERPKWQDFDACGFYASGDCKVFGARPDQGQGLDAVCWKAGHGKRGA